MKKNKAISLLTILSIVLAVLFFITFAKFPFGSNKHFNGILGAVELDSDIGNAYTFTLVYSDENIGSVEDVSEVTNTIEQRLVKLGYKNPVIKTVKSAQDGVVDYDILITLPAGMDQNGQPDTSKLSSDVDAAKAYGEIMLYGGTSENPTGRILENEDIISNAYYSGSFIDEDGSTKYSGVIKFTSNAYKFIKQEIKTAEEESATYYLTIKLGDETLLSGSLSSDTFIDSTLIITNSDQTTMKQNVLKISTGGLAYIYDAEMQEAAPALGNGAVTVSAVAICVSIVFIIAALLVFYRGLGVAGALSTLAFILVELAMLVAVPGIKLSMSGIIGILASTAVLGFGLNLTFKKISNEFAKGKTIKAAINSGFNKALKPVLLTNLISAVAGLLTFIFAGGYAYCFGITFGIGAVISFIATALLSKLYTSILLCLSKKPEKFFNVKREEA